MNKKDSPADERSQVAADFSSLFKATAERKSAEPALPGTSSTRLITVDELEEIIAENQQAWKTYTQEGKPEPEFPTLTGLFNPSCLVEAARKNGAEFPWLPNLLENTGNGIWKYSGFVVFDQSNSVAQSISAAEYDGSIVICHKGLGEVVLTFSSGRLVDLEILALLF